jgi:hypothetical protein
MSESLGLGTGGVEPAQLYDSASARFITLREVGTTGAPRPALRSERRAADASGRQLRELLHQRELLHRMTCADQIVVMDESGDKVPSVEKSRAWVRPKCSGFECHGAAVLHNRRFSHA